MDIMLAFLPLAYVIAMVIAIQEAKTPGQAFTQGLQYFFYLAIGFVVLSGLIFWLQS
jgi:hypothetical protein